MRRYPDYRNLLNIIRLCKDQIAVKENGYIRFDLTPIPVEYRNILIGSYDKPRCVNSAQNTLNGIKNLALGDIFTLLAVKARNVTLKAVSFVPDAWETLCVGDFYESVVMLTYDENGEEKEDYFNDLGVCSVDLIPGECNRISVMIQYLLYLKLEPTLKNSIPEDGSPLRSKLDMKSISEDDLPF